VRQVYTLPAFDESGYADENCPRDTGLSRLGECVIVASFPTNCWRDAILSSLTLAFDTIADTVTVACYGSDPGTLDACYRRQLANSLGAVRALDDRLRIQ
jgi:hypothetical protein